MRLRSEMALASYPHHTYGKLKGVAVSEQSDQRR